jgi:hypothetical protein
MAVWRTKACEMFGYKPGTFSYYHGVVEVADTLYSELVRAVRDGDEAIVARIFEYARWADAQESAGHLRSAVDILFFMKLFRDPAIESVAAKYLPSELLDEKRSWRWGPWNDSQQLVPTLRVGTHIQTLCVPTI